MSKLIQRSVRFRSFLILTSVVLMFVFSVCSYADIVRTWKVHHDCTDNVATLCSGATTRLQTKDQDDDYAVCATIKKGATDLSWSFAGDVSDDGKVLSSAEETSFDTAAAASGKNSFRLVTWNVTGAWTGFYTAAYGLAVMDGGNAGTLAHEVGHYAECEHNEEGKTHRIMYSTFVSDKNTVNSTEKGKYQAKN
ncbi:MAG TPA: hypothetical protein VMX13_15230 [Sedimentisphaerales bacterium]|nr:hypothetical protein [Sedimentisphaerales bacterium]